MTIQSIRIENFKRFKDVTIDLGHQITLLYGENSAGKSSVLKAILGLVQTFSEDNKHQTWSAQGQFVDLGLYKDYIKDHDIKNKFSISLRSHDYSPYVAKVKRNKKYITEQSFTYEFDSSSSQAKINSFQETTLSFEKDVKLSEQIMLGPLSGDPRYSENKYVSVKVTKLKTRSHYKLSIDPLTRFSIYGDPNSPPAWVKDPHSTDSFDVTFENKFNISEKDKNDEYGAWKLYTTKMLYERAINETASLLAGFHYLGPLRMSPMRSYTLTHHTSKVGADGKLTPLVLSFIAKKAEEDKTKTKIHALKYSNFRKWFNYIFPEYEILVEPSEDIVRLKVKSFGRVDSISDVGFGFSQVLPILVQASALDPGDTLIIEQPELHLHPKAQVAFAAFVTEAAKSGVKFIIETHSEHILRGLQLKVSENNLDSKQGIRASNIKIYYFHKDAKVTNMILNEFGEIEGGWPAGFFDESYKISSQILKNKISDLNNQKKLRE